MSMTWQQFQHGMTMKGHAHGMACRPASERSSTDKSAGQENTEPDASRREVHTIAHCMVMSRRSALHDGIGRAQKEARHYLDADEKKVLLHCKTRGGGRKQNTLCRGVLPSVSLALSSAPSARSSTTTGRCPNRQARCRGVCPILLVTSSLWSRPTHEGRICTHAYGGETRATFFRTEQNEHCGH